MKIIKEHKLKVPSSFSVPVASSTSSSLSAPTQVSTKLTSQHSAARPPRSQTMQVLVPKALTFPPLTHSCQWWTDCAPPLWPLVPGSSAFFQFISPYDLICLPPFLRALGSGSKWFSPASPTPLPLGFHYVYPQPMLCLSVFSRFLLLAFEHAGGSLACRVSVHLAVI